MYTLSMKKELSREETLIKCFKSTIFERLAENFAVFQKESFVFIYFLDKNYSFV